MNRVQEGPIIPAPLSRTIIGLADWGASTTRILTLLLQEFSIRINRVYPKDGSESADALPLIALAADPADPADDHAAIWLSDGTGAGDNGDLMVKITNSAGTTKIATLIDYSTLP